MWAVPSPLARGSQSPLSHPSPLPSSPLSLAHPRFSAPPPHATTDDLTELMATQFEGEFGDRRVELVFIGPLCLLQNIPPSMIYFPRTSFFLFVSYLHPFASVCKWSQRSDYPKSSLVFESRQNCFEVSIPPCLINFSASCKCVCCGIFGSRRGLS